MNNQDWVQAINDSDDPHLRLVYSDWLEEQGRIVEAFGWRKLVELKKQPHISSDHKNKYFWFVDDNCNIHYFIKSIYFIKLKLKLKIYKRYNEIAYYDSKYLAEQDFALVLGDQ